MLVSVPRISILAVFGFETFPPVLCFYILYVHYIYDVYTDHDTTGTPVWLSAGASACLLSMINLRLNWRVLFHCFLSFLSLYIMDIKTTRAREMYQMQCRCPCTRHTYILATHVTHKANSRTKHEGHEQDQDHLLILKECKYEY